MILFLGGSIFQERVVSMQTWPKIIVDPDTDQLRPQGKTAVWRVLGARELCTEMLHVMAIRHRIIFDHLFTNLWLIQSFDKIGEILADEPKNEDGRSLENAEKDPLMKKYARFSGYASESMCISLVDNFLTFLTEISQACMKSKPHLLKSGDSIKIDEILRFENFNDLVDFLIDRKINSLSYGGIKGIRDFLSDRLGLDLFSDDAEEALLTASIEVRNIHTHNRGIVSHLTAKRLEGVQHPFSMVLGRRFEADFNDLVAMANNMFKIAMRLDVEASRKFELARQPHLDWQGSRDEFQWIRATRVSLGSAS